MIEQDVSGKGESEEWSTQRRQNRLEVCLLLFVLGWLRAGTSVIVIVRLDCFPSRRLVYHILNPELCHGRRMTRILKQVNASH